MNEENPMPDKEARCAECNQIFTYTPSFLFGHESFPPMYCDPCVRKLQESTESEKKRRAAEELKKEWAKICPALYADTDPARIPAHFKPFVDSWELNNIAPAFVGMAGQLKTRSAFELLKRHHFSGVWVEAISSTRFAKIAADQFDDDKEVRAKSRATLEWCHNCALLLLDDLGKQKMSERAELELYDLLEHRTSNMLPTVWTANAVGAELLAMFSKDRGEPILRRLAEFSEIPTRNTK